MSSRHYSDYAGAPTLKSFVLAAAGLFVSTQISAATPWILCELCQKADAPSTALKTGFIGELAVLSLRNRFILKFKNKQRGGSSDCLVKLSDRQKAVAGAPTGAFQIAACTYQIVTTPIAGTHDDNHLFDLLQGRYDLNGRSLTTRVSVTSAQLMLPDGPITGSAHGSAIDFVNNQAFKGKTRTAVRHWIDSPASINLQALTHAVAKAGTVLNAGGIKTRVTVTFGDASSASFVYTETEAADSETVRTAENGDVMKADNVSEFLGNRMMQSELSLENFLANARNLGVEIVRGHSSLTTRQLICASKVAAKGNKTITCSRN